MLNDMKNGSSGSRFDHAVIVTAVRMDEAAELFERLGFLLTPRGHHTLGSINHLIVLGSTYIELLGLPADKPDARPELRDSPLGLDALVFRSDDADETSRAGLARGAPLGPVQRFSRPVALGTGEGDAIFRTVRCLPGIAQAGRLYFCEHLTPELVWQPEWQGHPNGAVELVGAVVRVPDAAREAQLYAQLLGEQAVTKASDGVQVQADPVCIRMIQSQAEPAMTSLSLRVRNLAQTEDFLLAAGFDIERNGQWIRVPAGQAWNVELNFLA